MLSSSKAQNELSSVQLSNLKDAQGSIDSESPQRLELKTPNNDFVYSRIEKNQGIRDLKLKFIN